MSTELRRWQAEALPLIVESLRSRKRPIVSAVMGAGKSVLMAEVVSRALPKSIERGQVIVVVAPRRRLVDQLERTMSERLGSERVGVYHEDCKQPLRHVVVTTVASIDAVLEHQAAQDRQVSLLVVDECHSSEGGGLKAAIQRSGAVCQVGFTATPMRSVKGERLELWDEVVYRYSMDDALRDGVLVPMRVVTQQGVTNEELDKACMAMILAHGKGPGIVSASSIKDAESFSLKLRISGLKAYAIHSLSNSLKQQELLDMLRAGAIDCLVHVSLLAEGVDFPWLKWLCLRRETHAGVRFLQEIGRPMRSYQGKTECVVMDPHLLLGRFGLRPAEAIGKALEEAFDADEMEAERSQRRERPLEPTSSEALALDGLLGHLEVVARWLRSQGVIGPSVSSTNGWELAQVTERQVEAMVRARKWTRHVPEKHRGAVRAVAQVPYLLSRGEASLVLDVLLGGQKWARVESVRRGLDDRARWNLKWDEAPVDLDAAVLKSVEKMGRRMQRVLTMSEAAK